MKRIIFVVLALAAVSFMLAESADATCSITGGIARIITTPGSGTTTGIYIRTSALATIFYYATTTDQKIWTMAAEAFAGSRRVQIIGNAGTCPTTGTVRSIGSVVQIILGP
jgi:hypothetical protein